MKPTKEEMLDWLRFKSEGFDDDDPEYKAIRSLIEKYGDGGPWVTWDWIEKQAKYLYIAPNLEQTKSVLASVLRSIGVEVEED